MPDAAPHKSLARDIIISVFLASGLMTFIVTIAGQFAIDGIKQGVETQGLAGFWFPIVSTLVAIAVAVTALTLLALSLIRPRWRQRVWARLFSWVRGIRPVSTRRFVDELSLLNGLSEVRDGQAQKIVERERADWQGEVKRVDGALRELRESIPQVVVTLLAHSNDSKKSMAKELADLRAEVDRLKTADRERAIAPKPSVSKNHPDVVMAASSARPLPRWKFDDRSSASDEKARVVSIRVRNLVPESVARAVRVENRSGTYGSFEFHDAAYWKDLSGGASGDFSGRIVGTDEEGKTHLTLSWETEKGEREQLHFSVFKQSASKGR